MIMATLNESMDRERESLFQEWREVSLRVERLNVILQNPVEITTTDCANWGFDALTANSLLANLVHRTILHLQGRTVTILEEEE